MLTPNELRNIDDIAEKAQQAIFGQSTDSEELENYLEYQDIDVRWIVSDKVAGYLRWDRYKRCPVIAVSISGTNPEQQLYIMSHEIGSLVLKYNWKFFDYEHNSKLKLDKPEFLHIMAMTDL